MQQLKNGLIPSNQKKENLIKLTQSNFMDRSSLECILKWCLEQKELVIAIKYHYKFIK